MFVTILKYVGLIVGSYLLGGVLFAKILSKTQKQDIEAQGSGNPGTMNMLRSHGIVFGLCTFILDALKGVIAALSGFLLFGGFGGGMVAQTAIYIGGLSAVLGHMFPIYFKFKGGKGVATASGIAFVAHPFIGLGLFGVYILLLIIIKISSLSSLIIAVAYLVTDTILLAIDANYIAIVLLYILVSLIVWAHRSNIKRLREKRENVIDLKAAAQKDVDRINAIKQKHQTKNEQTEQNKNVQDEE